MKSKIAEYFNVVAQSQPIDTYALKYYEGITLRVVDVKKALKSEEYLNSLIK